MLSYILVMVFLFVIGEVGWYLVQGVLGLMAFFFFVSFVELEFGTSLGYSLGVDLISMMLFLLTIWISMLMLLASWGVSKIGGNCSYFLFLILLLCLILGVCFISVDILLFYIFFESTLVPVFFLVLGFGYQPERLQSGVYLVIYMVFSSFPLLIGILGMYDECVSFFCEGGWILEVSDCLGMVWGFSLLFAFLVSSPMYVVHLWLPSAHVEAPVSGSMVLAGVLLSLGGYGLVRFLGLLSTFFFSYFFISVALVGGFLVGMVCLRQSDVKSLIAYSSVVHMGLVIGGLFSFTVWGVSGCVVLMVGHGLCSSGLFCLANVVYVRMGSRSLLLGKGFMVFMPSMCLWWFLFSISNMSAPPSLGLVGEIWLIIGMMSWSWMVVFLLFFVLFLSACYSLYLYVGLQHGSLGSMLFAGTGGYVSEFFLLFLHWYPLNFLFLCIDCLMM